MSMDPAALLPLIQHLGTPRRIECVQISRTVTAVGSGRVILRCMGAGGGGGVGSNARGGNGGTVATKDIAVVKGDQFVITIPQGGVGRSGTSGGGEDGGTLTIKRGGITLISIPGGRGGLNTTAAPLDNEAPTGADWFVLGGRAGNGGASGGGGAMIVEGGTAAGNGGVNGGGGGALGDGATAGGGAITSAVGNVSGTGYLSPESCVLRIAHPSPVSGYVAGSNFVPGTSAFGGGSASATGAGTGGGFGGGGAKSTGTGSQPGPGGFAGGGGSGGNGGPGGGGGAVLSGTAGNGGQGWVTLEWIGGAA